MIPLAPTGEKFCKSQTHQPHIYAIFQLSQSPIDSDEKEKKFTRNKKEYAAVFFTGAVLYSLIEILWRGRTHWTMAITGGICLLLIHLCNERHAKLDMLSRCSLSSFYITGVEFAVGWLLNIRLNMMVWDYSDKFLNVMGQICLEYWAYWYLLSIPAIMLSTIILAVRKARGGKVNF